MGTENWWTRRDSNPRPSECHSDAQAGDWGLQAPGFEYEADSAAVAFDLLTAAVESRTESNRTPEAWSEGPVTVLLGDVRERLRDLPDLSVHCVVTSPPYWGLRDYNAPGQLGLEVTPEEYVVAMVQVFREVRRVLRPDGTCWVNLGDSYASGEIGRHDQAQAAGASPGLSGLSRIGIGDGVAGRGQSGRRQRRVQTGLKPKDLCGIPWRVAFALQADGWWLRSDIVWSKPNPMPESVTDRPTRSHEYLFLLTKSARYFYDAEAVREDWAGERNGAPGGKRPAERNVGGRTDGFTRPRQDWTAPEGRTGRNLRSVWNISTQPYAAAHFATYPEELARRCIAAGTSERGCCPECGAPWRRCVEIEYRLGGGGGPSGKIGDASGITQPMPVRKTRIGETTGWQPTCRCEAGDPTPTVVLDPFAGSGTTLAVARRMGRRAIGIELQADYLPLIRQRVQEAALPLIEEPGPGPDQLEQLSLLEPV